MVSSPRRLESGYQFGVEHTFKSHYLIRIFKMMKCPFLLALLFLGYVFTMSVHGAPSSLTGHSVRSMETELLQEEDTNVLTYLPTPPSLTREERKVNPPQQIPHHLPFIKNPKCQLHRDDGYRRKMCGLREIDLPGGASGVRSWNPGVCLKFHCKCVATKEVRRMKRTIADNKTTLDYHKFRVFECV